MTTADCQPCSLEFPCPANTSWEASKLYLWVESQLHVRLVNCNCFLHRQTVYLQALGSAMEAICRLLQAGEYNNGGWPYPQLCFQPSQWTSLPTLQTLPHKLCNWHFLALAEVLPNSGERCTRFPEMWPQILKDQELCCPAHLAIRAEALSATQRIRSGMRDFVSELNPAWTQHLIHFKLLGACCLWPWNACQNEFVLKPR